MSKKPPTLAEDLQHEADQLSRHAIHHARPRGPLTLAQAAALAATMALDDFVCTCKGCGSTYLSKCADSRFCRSCRTGKRAK